MAQEPTIQELQKRILELEKEVAARQQNEGKLSEGEEKYKVIFNNVRELIIYVGINGRIMELNDRLEELFGYKREDLLNKHFNDIGVLSPEDMKRAMEVLNKATMGKAEAVQEYNILRKDNTTAFVEASATIVKKDSEVKGVIIIIRDVTKRKRSEKRQQRLQDELEKKVKDRTANLEEANTALKVLLKKREEDKVELEEKVLFNVKDLILPYIESLGKSVLNGKQTALVDIIQSNLNDIVSPFARGLSTRHLMLTPTEIQVANLIKHGKSTKGVAEFLNLSSQTVEFHRKNIRKKVGIKNRKINLRTYLLSIQ